jgi:MATE family multidrug resistance protein
MPGRQSRGLGIAGVQVRFPAIAGQPISGRMNAIRPVTMRRAAFLPSPRPEFPTAMARTDRLTPFVASLRELMALAVPIVTVQVGIMMIGVTDLVIVGHVSASTLAAVAVGNVYFTAPYIFALGFLTMLDPLVAQGLGAGDEAQATLSVQRGLVVALVLSGVVTLVCLPAEWALRLLQQPPEVVPQAAAFVRASIPGSLPALVFLVFRQTLQAMKRPGAIVITIVAANVFNALLCATLVLGWFGSPRLGAVGAAWAGTAARWFMAICLLAIARRELMPRLEPIRREAFDARALVRLAGFGAPLGIQVALEYGVFAVVAVMMGRFGVTAVAGHQVAINLVSLTFMVPLGISGAASVLIGHAVGRADVRAARFGAAASIATGVGWMLLTSAMFVSIPRWLASLYTTDRAVLDVAALLLPIAGVFQVFDGTQVVAIGLLRGLGDTRAPMWINIVGFWLFGFPVSLALGFRLGWGPAGLWWGFVAGLAVVAVLLLARTRSRLDRDLTRVRLDAPAQTAGT